MNFELSTMFGASASVCIHFDGTLQTLAEKLSTALHFSGFTVEPDEYPPHHEVGSAEVLGWELWLEASQAVGELTFRLETTHVAEEVFHGRMHDLSPWLARYLVMMCDLRVTPTAPDSPRSAPRG